MNGLGALLRLLRRPRPAQPPRRRPIGRPAQRHPELILQDDLGTGPQQQPQRQQQQSGDGGWGERFGAAS